jgi:hypothetical protein
MMAAGEEAATAFVETSLGTRLAVSFPAANTTVADLKRKPPPSIPPLFSSSSTKTSVFSSPFPRICPC